MPATPLPPLIFAPGAGAPTVGLGLLRYLLCRSTAPGANGVIGNSGAAGWHSHPGRVLLQQARSSLIYLCRSTAPGANGVAGNSGAAVNIRTRGGCSYSSPGFRLYICVGAPPSVRRVPNAGTPKPRAQKNRLEAGFSVSAERNQAAVARALMCAFRRLL